MRAVEFILEAENPLYVGGNQNSPIPGTPESMRPKPSAAEIKKKRKQELEMEKWVKQTKNP